MFDTNYACFMFLKWLPPQYKNRLQYHLDGIEIFLLTHIQQFLQVTTWAT